MAKIAETEIAAAVVAWLAERGFEVYQEVQVKGRGRCDLVGVGPRLLVAVEVKTSLSLRLLAQAASWRSSAHLVWAAAPPTARSHAERSTLPRVCAALGIGLLAIRDFGGGLTIDEERVAPLLRRIDTRLRSSLHEEQKTFAPAGSTAGHWSPFKDTCRQLERAAGAEPLPLAEVIGRIKHHYRCDSTARSSLQHWIEGGLVPGLRIVREGRKILVARAA